MRETSPKSRFKLPTPDSPSGASISGASKKSKIAGVALPATSPTGDSALLGEGGEGALGEGGETTLNE